jgi:hypothetical protein
MGPLRITTRRWRLAGLGAAILIAIVAGVQIRGDDRGLPRSPGVAAAAVPEGFRVGLIDPSRSNYVLVEWDSQSANYGKFMVGLPELGMVWGNSAGTITSNQDGTKTLSYSGNGQLDADAQLDPLFGRTFTLSGSSAGVSVNLSIVFSANLVAGSGSVTVGQQTYLIEAPAPTHNADDAIEAILSDIESSDWSGMHAALNRNFVAAVSESAFATAMSSEFGSHGSVVSADLMEDIVYLGEPGPGYHLANSRVRFIFSASGAQHRYYSFISMVLDGGAWKLLTLDPPVTETLVSPANMHGWGFVQETATATGSLVSGPGTPPSGSGSAKIALGSTGGGLYGTLGFAGTRLDAIDAINYSTYEPTGNPGTVQAISLQFDMDYNLTDSTTSWQGRLVYEPYFTETVTKGTWQTWDPLAGKWWATGSPGNTKCPQSNPCTWSKVLQEFPNAGLRASVGGLEFKAGSGWPANWQGNVDAFVIVVGDDVKAFDFEP